MPVHVCKLLPSRPSLPGDMMPAEAGPMREHVANRTGLARRGGAQVVGPLLDPAGAFGLAVEAEDATAAALTAKNPVVRVEAGFRHEIYPLPQVILRSDFNPQPVREGASREA